MKTTKYELFQISGISLERGDDVVKKLRRFKFSQKDGAGFVIDLVRKDRIEARFVEFREEQVVFADPFGNEDSFTRSTYETTSFQFCKSSPNLILSNSPRSRRAFFSSLSEAFDDAIAVQSAEIDPINFLKEAENEGYSPRITKATLSNVSLSSSVSAKLVISGTEDVREHFKILGGKRPYKISNVTVELSRETKEKVEVSPSGRIKVTSENPGHVLEIFRSLFHPMA